MATQNQSLYMADLNLSTDNEYELKAAIKDSRGVGNFRSLFINNRRGKVDAEKVIKIIPAGGTDAARYDGD